MIATVSGTLTEREGDMVVVETAGGVGYAVTVPLGVFQRLPAPGSKVRLYTELVVREDGWLLFGFDQASERTVFQRLLLAGGFGPRLALAMLSTLGPARVVASIRNKDVAALATVSGIGRKKAERLILELSDRFGDLPATPGPSGRPRVAEEAAQALTALGYPPAAAEEAVRSVLDGQAGAETAQVVRRALQWITTSQKGT